MAADAARLSCYSVKCVFEPKPLALSPTNWGRRQICSNESRFCLFFSKDNLAHKISRRLNSMLAFLFLSDKTIGQEF